MSSLKLRKIAKIVKEMNTSPSQSRYDISGLTLGLCKFFYRISKHLFQDLGQGDYTIDTSNNSQVLVIQNSELLKNMEAIQVCYILDTTSSKYETDFNVDINQLKDEYNHLVDDVHALWDYVKKVGIVADDNTIPLILPQLDTNELWIKTDDGYKGITLTDAEGEIKKVIDAYTTEKIEEISNHVNSKKKELDAYEKLKENEIQSYTSVKKNEIEQYSTTKKSEIESYAELKKEELDEHELKKEQELTDLKEMLASQLSDLVEGALYDKGIMENGSDWHLLDKGTYYVANLFNSNFKNHPYDLANSDESKGIVIVNIADKSNSKIVTYHSTSKRIFFTIMVKSGIWSEWAVLGSGTGTVYEITQNNHGFNFNTISLNGNTNKWELADKSVGADALAIKIDDNRFQLILSGQGIIPTSARDDDGNEFVADEYYFMSTRHNGKIQRDKPNQRIFQTLFHTRMSNGKLVADIEVSDVHDLKPRVVTSDTAKEYGLVTEEELDAVSYYTKFNFNTLKILCNKLSAIHIQPNVSTSIHNTNGIYPVLMNVDDDPKLCFGIGVNDKFAKFLSPLTMISQYDMSSDSSQLYQVTIKEQKNIETGLLKVVYDKSSNSPALNT